MTKAIDVVRGMADNERTIEPAIWCPSCRTSYITATEERPAAKSCTICKGQAKRAQKYADIVHTAISEISERMKEGGAEELNAAVSDLLMIQAKIGWGADGLRIGRLLGYACQLHDLGHNVDISNIPEYIQKRARS